MMPVNRLHAQPLTADHLIHLASLISTKTDAFIQKKHFYSKEHTRQADTLVSTYLYNRPVSKKNNDTASVERLLQKSVFDKQFFITYSTTSFEEYAEIKHGMLQQKFTCYAEADSAALPVLLYQKEDITVHIYTRQPDSVLYYCFRVFKKDFTDPASLVYADQLLQFSSHEYLEYYFGKPNVKRDIFYLSGNDMVRCSVLFPNTSRQVVFIWADEKNKTGIASLLFGGQQRLHSAMENSSYVGESAWRLKSGIHAGMTLYELRRLNQSNFKFYGGNSANTGAVLPDNEGRLDFRREDVILSCINCNDKKFYASHTLDADEAIDDGRIVFVLSVILNPSVSSTATLP